MRFMKVYSRRAGAFLLALSLFFCPPVADYVSARDARAMSLGMTAVEYVFDVLFHAAGVNALENTSSLIADMENWIKIDPSANLKYLMAFETLRKAAWGTVLEVGQEAIDMVRDYFRGKGDYGKGEGISSVVIGNCSLDHYRTEDEAFYKTFNGVDNTEFVNDKFLSSFNAGRYCFSYETDSAFYDVFSSVYNNYYGLYYGTDKDGSTYISGYNAGTFIHNSLGLFSLTMDKASSSISFGGIDRLPHGIDIRTIPIPFYDSKGVAYDHCNNGGLYPEHIINGYTDGVTFPVISDSVPVKSLPDIQTRPIQIAGEFRVPATAEEAYAKYVEYSAATTADEMSAALADTVGVSYGDKVITGDTDDAFPWVPDITAPLQGILDKLGFVVDALSGLKAWVTDIPAKLDAIRDGIVAIPGQVSDFFTVDTAAVHAAAVGLLDAFKAKFPALYGLSGIFNVNRVFNDVIPVLSIDVPDFLKFAYPGQDRIVVLDLRPYEGQLTSCRAILSAVLWLCFARWLLDQFDVHFGVN